jgi:hypothetical protein
MPERRKDPRFHPAGSGWHLRSGKTYHSPRDYEGRIGDGLALPMLPMSWGVILGVGFVGAVFTAIAALVVVRLVAFGEVSLFGLLLAVVLGAIGVVALKLAGVGVRQQRQPDLFLLLSVDALRISMEGNPVVIPWHGLGELRRHWTQTDQTWPRRPPHNWLTFEVDTTIVTETTANLLVDTKLPTVNVDQFAVEPHLVVAIIQFYRDHAEERAELRTVEGLDRADEIARTLSR